VVNGNAVSSNSGNGIYIYETTDSNIGNNSCNNNGECGIEFAYCSDCSINGNNASANGANMDNFYANINLSGDGTKNSIQNNVCRKGSGTQKPKYGISISQSAITYTLIANNDCYEGGVTRGIYDLGTNTTFGQNRNNDGTWSTTPN
jgi:parallel beta-helix repeat protein